MAHTGRLRPKGAVPFSGFKYMKGKRNLSFRSVKAGPKGLTDAFYGHEKVKKTSGFVIYSYFKDNAFTVVKRKA